VTWRLSCAAFGRRLVSTKRSHTMRDTTDDETAHREERLAAGNSLRAKASGTPMLPRWESFPVGDRDRLVRQILRTARRQVEVGPAGRLPTT
jgi:hypothetical protein